MQKRITKPELKVLEWFVGKKLSCIGGEYLDSSLYSDSIFIKAEDASAFIWGDYFSQDFAGFGDDFSFFRVDETKEKKVEAATKKGNLYYFHAGESITNINLARLTVTRINKDGSKSSYMTDIAIVFFLTRGSLTLFRDNLHLESFQVSFSSEIGNPKIGLVETHYGQDGDMDDGVVFRFATEFVDLQDALSEPE
jgi:hypothetical protein